MMLALYPSKKDLKATIGEKLKYKETSMFGPEYQSTGKFCVANRPSITGFGREFFAEVEMENDLIKSVK